MRPLSRSIAVAWVLPVLWLACHAAAEPAGSGEAGSRPDGFEAAPAATANESAAVQVDSMLSSGAAGTTASSGGAGAASPSVQAMEIMREAQDGAAESDLSRLPPRAAARSARQAATAGANGAADEGGLRDMGKTALQWLKDTLPWLRKEPDEDSVAARHSTDGLASPFEDGKTVRSVPVGAADHAGALVPPQTAPGAALGNDSNARGPAIGSTQNTVSEVIEFARVVLGHPMTWLGVALFVIGALALSKFDRRPK